MSTATPEFEHWAKGFSGMDGGNLLARLWYCGIEFGGDKLLDMTLCDHSESISGRTRTFTGVPWVRDDDDGHFIGNGYDWRVAKMSCQIAENSMDSWRLFREEVMCKRHGWVFKMNLYPFNFKSTDEKNWTSSHHGRLSGLTDMTEYRLWCEQHRFPFLRTLFDEFRPSVVICTGVGWHEKFMDAIGPSSERKAQPSLTTEASAAASYPVYLVRETSMVFVVPFFGRRMTTNKIAGLGKCISQRLAERGIYLP